MSSSVLIGAEFGAVFGFGRWLLPRCVALDGIVSDLPCVRKRCGLRYSGLRVVRVRWDRCREQGWGSSRAIHENHDENDILYGTYHWGTITRNELNMSHKPRADFNKNGVNRHRGL